MSSAWAIFWNHVPQFESRLPTKYGPKLRCASTRSEEFDTGAVSARAMTIASPLAEMGRMRRMHHPRHSLTTKYRELFGSYQHERDAASGNRAGNRGWL